MTTAHFISHLSLECALVYSRVANCVLVYTPCIHTNISCHKGNIVVHELSVNHLEKRDRGGLNFYMRLRMGGSLDSVTHWYAWLLTSEGLHYGGSDCINFMILLLYEKNRLTGSKELLKTKP